jgi:hypothetical protein
MGGLLNLPTCKFCLNSRQGYRTLYMKTYIISLSGKSERDAFNATFEGLHE